MEAYILILTGFGTLVLLTAWLPLILYKAPLSLPIICVALGAGIFALPVMDGRMPHTQEHLAVIERLTEFCIIIALMGAGLKLDRPLSWSGWNVTWRLIGGGMSLTIAALAILAHFVLGLGPAAALLLAAALAPTDAVLASDIQVGPPRSGEEDETRFALTSEAGVNDGLAFPFVHAAIALALGTDFNLDSFWIFKMVVWKIMAAIAIGHITGRGLGWIMFHLPKKVQLSRTGDGFVALGTASLVYGVTEIAEGYGFLAVFIAAVSLRSSERHHHYHDKLHDVAEGFEKLVMMTLLVLFGGLLTDGDILNGLDWRGAVFGLAAIFLVRPLCAWISLDARSSSLPERAAICFYGIRGVGTVYYIAYALQRAPFENTDLIWATASFIILISVFLHGSTATPVMQRIDIMRCRQNHVAK
jgi:sodium/hydrogen antiporter